MDEFIVTFTEGGKATENWSRLMTWWEKENSMNKRIAAVTFGSLRISPFHCINSTSDDQSFILPKLKTRSSKPSCVENTEADALNHRSHIIANTITDVNAEALPFYREQTRSICVGPSAHQKYIANVAATSSLNIHEPISFTGELIHLGASRGRVNHYSDGLSIANADAICSWTREASTAEHSGTWRSTFNICSGGLILAKSGKLRPETCEKHKAGSEVEDTLSDIFTILQRRILEDPALYHLHSSTTLATRSAGN